MYQLLGEFDMVIHVVMFSESSNVSVVGIGRQSFSVGGVRKVPDE
ncbi:MAG: hypothetical protein PUJ75_07910 [Bacteroidales bacterium]|nr:hypothetical protein [Bacteroidales bacterium]MDY5788877.1 hypothetical protein [Candidatus Onthomorpha sp.]